MNRGIQIDNKIWPCKKEKGMVTKDFDVTGDMCALSTALFGKNILKTFNVDNWNDHFIEECISVIAKAFLSRKWLRIFSN